MPAEPTAPAAASPTAVAAAHAGAGLPQALVCHQLADDLSGLSLAPQPRRPLAPGEVRLRVLRVALNFPDLLMTQGLYHLRPPLPFVPGMEGVAEVLETGPGAPGLQPGQRLCFGSKTGGLAQETVLPASALAPCPAGLSLDEAAAHMVTGLTAWVALARVGRLLPGETLLVHGARGGVGMACVQLGLHLGARVIASASQPERLGDLAAQGVTVLRSDDTMAEAVLAATAGRGVDAVADPVGGDVFDASLRCCAYGARLLVLGFASGQLPRVKLQRVLNKGLTLHGVRAGEYGRQHPEHALQHRQAVTRLAEAGVLRPPVGAVFAFDQAVAALKAMRDRTVAGKIVVNLAD
ncbi:NADPH:quinone oxidoreductase family protein [Aquabacterium sp. OR-4]|uniref:NADPH:quinone oxidoreductase family protein n=1 Tax=Aquabacterium sp. OR-4 TaxID=2978127 RepID=UPI0021B39056|nr:NADPH:quinone oxidoreductase family protein [Aquabacterium sp. OR-4]MDT7838173.1 NADPH:quinone oxidoreductase family protein [Aquabacterium sp. OR-4]